MDKAPNASPDPTDLLADLEGSFKHIGFDEAVVFLHREYRGRQSTQDFTKDDGTVEYLYDTSVVKAFTDFMRTGAMEADGNYGYGATLPSYYDPKEMDRIFQTTGTPPKEIQNEIKTYLKDRWAAQINAHALARAAFDQTTPPYKQLGPHYDETTRMIANAETIVAVRCSASLAGQIPNRVLNALITVAENLPKDKKKQLDISGAISKLIINYAHEDPVLIEHQLGKRLKGESGRKPFDPVTDADPELNEFFQDYFLWRMKSLRSYSNINKIRVDAYALALIAVANFQQYEAWCHYKERDDAENAKKHKKRYIFVSADRTVIQATYDMEEYIGKFVRETPKYQETLKRVNKYKKWCRRFSRHYIRHLFAFTAELEGADESDKNTRIDTFLQEDLLAGYEARHSKADAINLVKSEQEVLKHYIARRQKKPRSIHLKDQEQGVREAHRQWSDLMQECATLHAGKVFQTEPTMERHIRDLITTDENAKNNAVKYVEDFSKALRELIEDSFDIAAIEFSDVAVADLFEDAKTGNALRNAPALNYESLKNARAFFEFILDVQQNGQATDDNASDDNTPLYDTFQKKFNAIILDVDDVTYGVDKKPHPNIASIKDELDLQSLRKVNYLQLVGLGAAFAAVEKWPSALYNAHRAVNLAKRIDVADDDGLSHFSGREAHFLAATCHRVRTKDAADLKEAGKHLDASEKAYNADLVRREKLGEDEAEALKKLNLPIRITSERFAIKLSAYYLERYENKSDPATAKVKEAQETFAALLQEHDKLGALLEALDETPLTKLSIATNVIQLAVIEHFQKDRLNNNEVVTCVDNASLRLAVDALTGLKNAKKIIPTDLVKTYHLVGQLLLGDTIKEGEIGNVFANRDDYCVSHYDEWRFESLFEYAEELREQSKQRSSA